jgi:hypothetical protein
VRELALVLILVIALCFGLAHMQKDQKAQVAQDVHTQILRGSIYDKDCDPTEMTLRCNGGRPR